MANSNREVAESKEHKQRYIEINSGNESKFASNSISTSKYNFATFLPKFLAEQFSRYANAFFLLTSIIQLLPNISPTNKYATLVPLLIVLFFTAIKEIVEDYKRHRSDAEVNCSIAKVLQEGSFKESQWTDVRVGDVVRVENNSFFPADLVLLSSSEPEALCYIETSNLDGETNLKIKQGLPETADITSPQLATSKLRGSLDTELPNSSLYTFDGTLNLTSYGKYPLSASQLLLRGAKLRNTQWIYGIVIFTGHETKLLRNATAAPIKRTDVDRMTNIQIIFLFIILIVMAISCSIGALFQRLNNSSKTPYLNLGDANPYFEFGKNFLTFLLLFNNLIPISLIVTLEFIKYQQSNLINNDLEMYHEETDTPALARTSTLVEELGQIEYIFSDKTGTLTQNLMEFRNCSVGSRCYATIVEEGKEVKVDSQGVERGYHNFSTLKKDVNDPKKGPLIDEFFTLLAVCHTVIPEKEEGSEKIIYQASSPDEAALVEGARDVGFSFHTRKPSSVIISKGGNDVVFEVLQVCEFNSTRKRMSTVVRCPDGKIRLYCKGADTVIFERLKKGSDTSLITQHLEEFAGDGLRTLCMAMREISKEEYDAWVNKYNEAATSIVNRSEKLDDVAELIEKDFDLLGATAIEDKLQDGVPDTIFTLAQAGIKIWVLTGDRQETAINIGYSCKLLTEDMELIIFDTENLQDTSRFIKRKLKELKNTTHNLPFGLIISGSSLVFALDDSVDKLFLKLATRCKAVICCRVSPLQKALVVKLVKKNTSASLLAIGDGANDVSMIQAAHVGVGIRGVEGLQAARSSDYAISQFRYLKRLLLVHGAWSYQRLCKVILYSFYKNITLFMTQFWFVFFNAFSGQILYESYMLTFYNVIFTVMPPLVLGLFDQPLNALSLSRYPLLYKTGQKRELFNVQSFWGTVINGFLHSLILYSLTYFIFLDDQYVQSGLNGGHWFMGTTLYTSALITVLLKASLLTGIWNKFTVIAIPGSFILWICYIVFGSCLLTGLFFQYQGLLITLQTPIFWMMAFSAPLLCIVRDVTWKYIKRTYFAKPYHIVQEIQKEGIPDYRPNMDRFKRAVNRVRFLQRQKQSTGYAFSHNESRKESQVIRVYDTTQRKKLG